jgi:GNAT superfamily N-acetyltransferase
MAPRQDLIDPGAMLATTHELRDGSRVRLRLTRPTDLPRIEALIEATPELPESLVRHFAFYDPRERLRLAAAMPSGLGEEIVGLADVALLATGLAELGVVVADHSQGRGVGALLSEAVASLAIQRGATHLKAAMRDDNTRMLHLMQRLGPTVRTMEDGNVVAYTRLPATRRRNAA